MLLTVAFSRANGDLAPRQRCLADLSANLTSALQSLAENYCNALNALNVLPRVRFLLDANASRLIAAGQVPAWIEQRDRIFRSLDVEYPMNAGSLIGIIALLSLAGSAAAGVAAVPEPGVAELLAIGAIAGVAVAIRKRRK